MAPNFSAIALGIRWDMVVTTGGSAKTVFLLTSLPKDTLHKLLSVL
jgi:hypothetical protein